MPTSDNILFLKKIEKYLASCGVLSPLSEAEALVLFFSKQSRIEFYAGTREISALEKKKILSAAKKRGKGAPSSHITGEAIFCGHRFSVNKHVLTPRPETEFLIEETLAVLGEHFAGKSPEILDLGTGSGCIAASLTIAHAKGRMTALDCSPRALAVARKNFHLLKLGKKIDIVKGELFSAFRGKNFRQWDIIVSNPPYVPDEDRAKLSREVLREPKIALFGGKKGLEIIRKVLAESPRYLKKGGWLLLEIGAGQSKILKKELEKNNDFSQYRFVKDFAGIDRILITKHG